MSQKTNFDGGKEYAQIRNENPVLGNWMRRVSSALNRLALNTGTSPVGQIAAPPTIGGLTVKASNGIVHVTVQDANEIHNSVEYFVEHTTDPTFSAPHVAHLKSSRGTFLNLPAKDDSGNAQSWYFRAYSQYPGSQPSAPVYFGGLSPTAVNVGGSTQLTPLQSPGSGTASPDGTQGGWGRGKTPYRPSQSTQGRP